MAQKDLSEKILMDYNDIFSDIINVLLFHGEQKVRQENLSNSMVHSQYKADDAILHEEERDCVKYWTVHNVRFAMLGIENQSNVFHQMPCALLAMMEPLIGHSSYRRWKTGTVVSLLS